MAGQFGNSGAGGHAFVRPLLVLLICAAFGVLFPATADAGKNHKYASIVMDAETGAILHQRHADKVLHPASLTKMMTLVMLFDEIEAGRLRFNDRLVMTSHAASMVPSKLNIPAGESIRVKDAIYALVTKSANDVAAAIAENIGGSEENFANMMTSKARRIGMSRTRFKNASGLHHPEQVSTARDMAKLARYIMIAYPQYYHFFSTKNFRYQGKSYRNHNRLMNSYDGMDGIKTGYIRASGFNLVASVVRNNRRLIGVVFGGRSAATRNRHMAELLDGGFSRLQEIRIASARVPLPGRKPFNNPAYALNASLEPALGAPRMAGSARAVAPAAREERWAGVNPALTTGMIGALIGEGDYDPAETRRFEAGLLAIAAHRGESIEGSRGGMSPVLVKAAIGREVGKQLARRLHHENDAETGKAKAVKASYRSVPDQTARYKGRWAVQIGAFQSRVHTDQVLTTALRSLPKELAAASPIIAPVRSSGNMIFRARLSGYSKSEAIRACQYFPDCITVAPWDP